MRTVILILFNYVEMNALIVTEYAYRVNDTIFHKYTRY